MKRNTRTTITSLISIPRDGRYVDLEYQLITAHHEYAPLMIFLHEGLGSVSMWRNWPSQVCKALKCRGLVYSRYGYGQSTARQANEARATDYLHHEAHDDLPALLTALGLDSEQAILYGHSDGGSIALLYAARFPDRVKAIAVAAPHIYIEDVTIKSVQAAKTLYRNSDLPERLARHHRDPDSVFWSWNDTWLAPGFRQWSIESEVSTIRCPILAIQGVDDEFGSLNQIKDIKRLAGQTQLCVIPDCGHSPHRDQPGVVMDQLTSFIKHLCTERE